MSNKGKQILDPPEKYRSFKLHLVMTEWRYKESYSQSILGFSGFAFEVVLLALLSVLVLPKINLAEILYLSTLSLKVAFVFCIIVPPAGWFWWMWSEESRRLRQYVTDFLNLYGDMADFEIPKTSLIHNRYVPEIALLLVLQTAVVIFLTVPL